MSTRARRLTAVPYLSTKDNKYIEVSLYEASIFLNVCDNDCTKEIQVNQRVYG